jgi:hypothetical protein
MQCTSSFQSIISRSLVIRHLLPAVNQTLLHRRDAFLFFYALFDLGDRVVALDVQFDFATGECADSV